MSLNYTVVSLLLKRLRIESGLSAKELSLKCNYPEYTVSRIENEKLKPDLLMTYNLLNGLGVSVDYFIGAAEKMVTVDNLNQLQDVKLAKDNLRAARVALSNSLNGRQLIC